jgi:hypothetical protein
MLSRRRQGNDELEHVAFAALTSVVTEEGAIGINENPALSSVVFPALSSIEAGAIGLFLGDNDNLTTLNFAQLEHITGGTMALMFARHKVGCVAVLKCFVGLTVSFADCAVAQVCFSQNW